MPATPITAEDIAVAANSPASASVDGRSATSHSIEDMIRALQLQQEAEAAAVRKSPWGGVLRAVGIPPSANGRI